MNKGNTKTFTWLYSFSFQGVIDKSLEKQFDDYLISQNLDPYDMTEAVKKSYEKAYVKEKYPGSSSTPGSMINALTSANPSQTLKVKIPNSEVGVKVSFR